MVIDSSKVLTVEDDSDVIADSGVDFCVLFSDDASEMEEVVVNISEDVSPDPKYSDEVRLTATDEVKCSLGVAVSCVSDIIVGSFSVLYSEEEGETVGFEEIIVSREVASAFEVVVTPVITSTAVGVEVSVNNDSFA